MWDKQLARQMGAGGGRGDSSVELACPFVKKSLVILDKTLSHRKTGLAHAGEWHGWASILERLLQLPLSRGLGSVQPPRGEVLVNRTRTKM